MCFYRRILKISLVERVTNDENPKQSPERKTAPPKDKTWPDHPQGSHTRSLPQRENPREES